MRAAAIAWCQILQPPQLLSEAEQPHQSLLSLLTHLQLNSSLSSHMCQQLMTGLGHPLLLGGP